jgi:hypothetical protein
MVRDKLPIYQLQCRSACATVGLPRKVTASCLSTVQVQTAALEQGRLEGPSDGEKIPLTSHFHNAFTISSVVTVHAERLITRRSKHHVAHCIAGRTASSLLISQIDSRSAVSSGMHPHHD